MSRHRLLVALLVVLGSTALLMEAAQFGSLAELTLGSTPLIAYVCYLCWRIVAGRPSLTGATSRVAFALLWLGFWLFFPRYLDSMHRPLTLSPGDLMSYSVLYASAAAFVSLAVALDLLSRDRGGAQRADVTGLLAKLAMLTFVASFGEAAQELAGLFLQHGPSVSWARGFSEYVQSAIGHFAGLCLVAASIHYLLGLRHMPLESEEPA